MTDDFVPLDPDSQAGYLVVRVADHIARPWFAALRAHKINPRQFGMLSCIAGDPGISQGELARRVLIAPQSVSESLASLLAAKLVTRGEVEPGRPAQLRLTAAGRRLLARAYPVVEATNRECFSMLTASEDAELKRLLKKVLDAG